MAFPDRFDPDELRQRLAHRRGPRRVVCFGGSSMAGAPLDYELSMCRSAALALGPDTEVVNLAGGGFDSLDVVRRARVACEFDHDLVLVMTGHNEFLKLRRFARGTPEAAAEASQFFRRFRFYRWLQQNLGGRGPERAADVGTPEVSDAEVYAAYKDNVDEILDRCGAQVVLSTLIAAPGYHFPEPDGSLRDYFRRLAQGWKGEGCRQCLQAPEALNDIVRGLARARGVALFEATALSAGDELFWDYVHPRPALHRELARGMLDVARAHGIVEATHPVRADISAARLRWAAEERGHFNLPLDPTVALALFEGLASPADAVQVGLGRALAGFVLDRAEAVEEGLRQAAEALVPGSPIELRYRRCAGLSGGAPERGGEQSRDCQLRCLPWCSSAILSPTEQASFAERGERQGNATLSGLTRTF